MRGAPRKAPGTHHDRVQITMEPELLKRIDAHAAATGKSRSAVIREAVEEKLKAQGIAREVEG